MEHPTVSGMDFIWVGGDSSLIFFKNIIMKHVTRLINKDLLCQQKKNNYRSTRC